MTCGGSVFLPIGCGASGSSEHMLCALHCVCFEGTDGEGALGWAGTVPRQGRGRPPETLVFPQLTEGGGQRQETPGGSGPTRSGWCFQRPQAGP